MSIYTTQKDSPRVDGGRHSIFDSVKTPMAKRHHRDSAKPRKSWRPIVRRQITLPAALVESCASMTTSFGSGLTPDPAQTSLAIKV